MDAFTSKVGPRYLFIVLALAGDSTITKDLCEFDLAIFYRRAMQTPQQTAGLNTKNIYRRFGQQNLELDK
jgi:hypothetical protein